VANLIPVIVPSASSAHITVSMRAAPGDGKAHNEARQFVRQVRALGAKIVGRCWNQLGDKQSLLIFLFITKGNDEIRYHIRYSPRHAAIYRRSLRVVEPPDLDTWATSLIEQMDEKQRGYLASALAVSHVQSCNSTKSTS
jgi:hypothetical protein